MNKEDLKPIQYLLNQSWIMEDITDEVITFLNTQSNVVIEYRPFSNRNTYKVPRATITALHVNERYLNDGHILNEKIYHTVHIIGTIEFSVYVLLEDDFPAKVSYLLDMLNMTKGNLESVIDKSVKS